MSRTLELLALMQETSRLPDMSFTRPEGLRFHASPMIQWLDEARMVLGEKSYPLGTVRTWKTGDFIKTPDGWVAATMPQRVGDKVVLGPGDEIPATVYTRNTQSSLDTVKAMLDAGTLPGTLESQVEAANATVKQHRRAFEPFLRGLREAAPKDAIVTGRVKTFESVLGKLVKKPKYKDARGLQDMTGTRIVCDDVEAVQRTVENLRKKYKVLSEDNYLEHPLGPMHYRSHHLIVEDTDGTAKEVQVRTKRQDTFGHFAHEAYKPTSDAKRQAIEEHGAAIEAYAAAVSDHFAKLDAGVGSKEPPVPELVRRIFGAIEHHV